MFLTSVFIVVSGAFPLEEGCLAPVENPGNEVDERAQQTIGTLRVRSIDPIASFHSRDPTAMFFNENKRKRLHNNRVKFPEDLVGVPTWPPLLCLGHQHGGRDVM